MNAADQARLIEAACAVRLQAYAPFSNFLVGAALLTVDGEIIVGCNVENVSYGLTICAERVAIGTAVASGKREFAAIAIASSIGCTPCGACRQVLSEFCPDLPVYLVNVDGGNTVTELSLAKLLPGRFEL
ncbi:MAG TPA: cytidine deaminase [Planctomycetaceae bacterium]|nr:cytidine deaminase [Planctomycetaceae bacterium]